MLSFIILICTIFFGVYFYVRYKYSYWSDRGIPFEKPEFPYGFLEGVGTKYHRFQKMKMIYDRFKESGPFVGMYSFLSPVILATDLEFVKTIFVEDFQYFSNRGIYFNKKDDPLSAHLVNLEGQDWKDLRDILSPAFTSNNMSFTSLTISSVADKLIKCMENKLKQNSDIEMKDILARYTTDVIGNCAFGLECNSLKDPNAEFRKMGQLVFEKRRNGPLALFLINNYPNLARKLHIKSFNDDITEFFMNAVRQTIDYRVANNIKKNDFMGLLIENYKEMRNDSEKYSLTFEEIAAQAFVFFLAGFDTSSTALSYAIYELAQNQNIQENARKEINKVLAQHNGNFTYEAVTEMKIIDKIVRESLRKYPPITNLIRRANSNYTVPGTNYKIEKETNVFIPVYAIHHDPSLFPNPEEFDPERFSEDAIQNRHPYAFLAFGKGPRVCIGLRFGVMQTRIGLTKLLLNFKFSVCPKTIIPVKFKPSSGIILNADGGLWLKVEKL